jgi:hypothetical protein
MPTTLPSTSMRTTITALLGGEGARLRPKRQCRRRMEKKEEKEENDNGMASCYDDSGEGKDNKGGMEYNPFFRPLMAWGDGRP